MLNVKIYLDIKANTQTNKQTLHFSQAVVVHAFNPSTQEAEAGQSLEFEASLVYRMSSRTVRTTQRNPVSKKQTKTKKQNQIKTKAKQNQNESETKQCDTLKMLIFSGLSLMAC